MVVAGVTLESMEVFWTAIKYHCHTNPQALMSGNQETDLWQGRVQGGRKPDALDCGAERKEGRELARGKRGERDEGVWSAWGEGGNHVLTVRTTTGNWLPPYPESIHKQANFAVG